MQDLKLAGVFHGLSGVVNGTWSDDSEPTRIFSRQDVRDFRPRTQHGIYSGVTEAIQALERSRGDDGLEAHNVLGVKLAFHGHTIIFKSNYGFYAAPQHKLISRGFFNVRLGKGF